VSAERTTASRPFGARGVAFGNALRWAEAHAGLLLALGVSLYVAIFTAAAWYKYASYGMGFDLGVHEQVLWNTAHGRIAASSPSVGTQSYFGIDIIVTELLLAPLYAPFPSVHVLLLAQTVALALGALPVYGMARDRLGSPLAGLALAACFLLYAPVQWMNLYEFQIRAFATTFLLLAVQALTRRRAAPFLCWSLLALGCRSDVGLALAGVGIAFLLGAWPATQRSPLSAQRSTLVFGLLPIALGLGWAALCTLVLIPAFRSDGRFLYGGVLLGEVSARCGQVPGRGLLNLPCLAQYVFAPGDGRGAQRLLYLAQMLVPLAFLPLLAPRALIPALPIVAINLLSNTPNIHASTHYHYQALVIPFALVAAVAALDALRRRRPRALAAGLVAALALSLACNLSFGAPRLGWGNPFFTLLGARPNWERIALVEGLIAQVPPEAALAATNRIGPHVARRQGLYVFPGDNIIYPTSYVARAEYLLVDSGELTSAADRAFFDALRAAGAYELLEARPYAAAGGRPEEITLWRRR
jgi:uncharacterized membrane protein